MNQALFGLSALLALVPAILLGMRRDGARDGVFYAVLAVACAGPLAWVLALTASGWSPSLGSALWITVAATMVIYAATALVTDHAWRLLPLVGGYLAILGALGLAWELAAGLPEAGLGLFVPTGWILIHVAVSVATYALATLSALAALSAFLQERALKRKRPSALSGQLPSVADSESLLVRLLTVGEVVLGLGLVTGMASQWGVSGDLLVLDHKTVLTVTAFAVIAALLIAHYRYGIRGRRATRIVLVAYLLLTLGYPGVKFVTQVLLGA
jgi:ABC-type uncharacterized transport system permease subunit